MATMINKALFTSNKEDWETPQDFYDRLNAKYHFEWDLAASDDNAKCSCYFTRDDNSLEQDWEGLSGNLFLNPPYGRELKLWVKKAATTGLKDKQNLVMLIPSRTDTSYWHDYIFNHAEIEFLRGRLKFEVDGVSGDSAPFPSAVVIYTGDGDDD
ncbi:DNA N-6-adenine-methyltransferase [Lactiplantibacillus plantarum]|nr:DNA N-6-adenine-methyltransferase [Lactiplantibacillus plantarum]